MTGSRQAQPGRLRKFLTHMRRGFEPRTATVTITSTRPDGTTDTDRVAKMLVVVQMTAFNTRTKTSVEHIADGSAVVTVRGAAMSVTRFMDVLARTLKRSAAKEGATCTVSPE